MKIENALKHFGPKGMNITGMSGGTSPDRITGTDLMAAMGMAEARASFGMAAFLGKSGISTQDKIRTVEELSKYALRHAPKLVVKSAGIRCDDLPPLSGNYSQAAHMRGFFHLASSKTNKPHSHIL